MDSGNHRLNPSRIADLLHADGSRKNLDPIGMSARVLVGIPACQSWQQT
jgi:hypothetical protein